MKRSIDVANNSPSLLSDRPYGIVGALNAGDTTGLSAHIISGRWDLAGDQAAFFLSQLEPGPATDYLDRFQFAEELARDFKPPRALREGELGSYAFGSRRIFYRAEGPDRLGGFLVDPAWLATLRDRQRRDLGVSDDRHQELWMYGGALTVILLVLSAGVGLLWRDVSREATVARLRSDFVSGASHDLKTPIALVRLYAETILRQPGLDDEKRREFHRVIVRESARLTVSKLHSARDQSATRHPAESL